MLLTAIIVGDVNAPPSAARFLVIHLRIVDLARRAYFRDAEPSDCRHHRVRRNENITLVGLEVDLRRQQFLLCIQDIEDRALADPLFFADPIQRGGVGSNRSSVGGGFGLKDKKILTRQHH